MIVGSSLVWLKHLKDIDHYFIQCVEKVWPQVISRMNSTSWEDEITQRLVDLLKKDKSIIKYGFLDYQYKLREEDIFGDFSNKGILDMALFLDQDYERYIAYECKRLNVITKKGNRSSLAGTYVDDGLMRYVTAQYAENLPFGCMIGYVMDGDTSFAIQQLELAVDKRKKKLNLATGKLSVKTGLYAEFETSHNRTGKKSSISVRHRIFSMS